MGDGTGSVGVIASYCPHRDLGAAGQPELGQDRADMLLHGSLGQHQSHRDAPVRQALRHQVGDLPLTRRERIPASAECSRASANCPTSMARAASPRCRCHHPSSNCSDRASSVTWIRPVSYAGRSASTMAASSRTSRPNGSSTGRRRRWASAVACSPSRTMSATSRRPGSPVRPIGRRRPAAGTRPPWRSLFRVAPGCVPGLRTGFAYQR